MTQQSERSESNGSKEELGLTGWKEIVLEQVIKSATATVTIAVVGSVAAGIIGAIVRATTDVTCGTLSFFDFLAC